MKTAILFIAALAFCASTAARAQDRILDMLRSDLRAERAAIIEEQMQFTEEEAAAFWPVFEKYEAETRKINDQRIELLKKYAANYENVTDSLAGQLAKKSIELDIKEAYLRKAYLREFNHVLPATRAAKFFQLDNLINLLVRTQVVSELPFIE